MVEGTDRPAEQIPNRRDEFIVGYDPKHKTAVEIWSDKETLIAKMPWGKLHFDHEANEILKTALSADRILVHEVRGNTDNVA